MTNKSGHSPDLGQTESLKQKLNRDTAKIRWSALSSYKQNESIIEVGNDLDLIDVACEFVNDNTAQVKRWLESGLLIKIDETTIQAWTLADPEVWAVVVPPWILIQQKP